MSASGCVTWQKRLPAGAGANASASQQPSVDVSCARRGARVGGWVGGGGGETRGGGCLLRILHAAEFPAC
jgi:hypothetical protein